MLAGRWLPVSGLRGALGALALFAVGGPGLELGLKIGRLFFDVVFAGGFVPVFDELGITFVGFENIASHPCFSWGTAPGIVDKPDRNAESLLKLEAEPVAYGGKAGYCLGGASFPLAIEIVLRFLRSDLGNGDEANLRRVGGRSYEVSVVGVRNGPLHVRLA